MKDNRYQALSILLQVEKRLKKDDVACKAFREQFNDFIERKVIRELSQEEMDNYKGPVNYISIFEVKKEDSASTPIRIVSNSSLKYEGMSFSDTLMKGPNTLNDLYKVLLKFRTYPVALVGDLAKMYHTVLTTEKELHLRRILWRDMKLDEEPKTYGPLVVMFGDKCAPAITSAAIRETADLYSHIDKVAAEKIKDDMYVDDMATGGDNHEETELLKKNASTIMEKGGFHFKGFVMSGDTKEENIALLGTGEVGRVLGIGWNPTEDAFVVNVRINTSKKFKGARKGPDMTKEEIPSLIKEKFSRRLLLGLTNSIYDVYGFLVPITIQLKILLRETYKNDLNLRWDDDIPQELKEKAVAVLLLAKEAEKLRFERCISGEVGEGLPTLIIFNDGSKLAMCAVAFIRWRLKSGEYHSKFIAAKAKVTPLERMTIPRSEMQSALIGVRLSKVIQEACGYEYEEVVHITDSQCSIATLAKDSTALKEFMANR